MTLNQPATLCAAQGDGFWGNIVNPQPQIALVSARSWAIIGPFFSHTGLIDLWPLPPVDCPVVDASLLDPEQVQRIVQSHVRTSVGVDDVDALIDALQQAGARLPTPFPETAYPIDLDPIIHQWSQL